MSRFSQPQDPLFQALDRSLRCRPAPLAYDVAQSRAHSAMLAAQGIIAQADKDAIHEALDQVEQELAQGRFRSGPTTSTSTWRSSVASTELAGPAGGKIHTGARATTRSRPNSRSTSASTPCASPIRSRCSRARSSMSRSVTSIGRCRAIRICSGPNRCTCRTTCSRTCGCSSVTASVSLRRPPGRCAPLGAGALAGVNFDTDRTHRRPRARLRPAWCRIRSTPSPTATSPSICSRPARCSRRTSRASRRDRAVDEFRVRLHGTQRRMVVRSSLMPQKKNPDCGELLRGKAPRVSVTLRRSTA